MKLLYVLGIVLLAVNAVPLEDSNANNVKLRYDNYQVYKLYIENELQLSVIKFLGNKEYGKYNIWKEYDNTTKEIHIMVNPKDVQNFLKLIETIGITQKLITANVQDLIDEEAADINSNDKEAFGWTSYNNLTEIEAWLDSILATYSDVTESFIIGKSYEGRNIRGIKISHKAGNPGIFIESNIHAREWITSATATWFINELLTSTKEEVRNLAQNYDWYIIPVFNVDGFFYTHAKDRMWRKTRQPVNSSICIGTDANRNFDSYWMVNGGASDNPCDETFAGLEPFSTPEAKALADFVTNIKDKIKIFIAFHSYGQLLLSPYGHTTTETPDNYNDLLAIGKEFHDAVYNLPYQTEYKYGSTAIALYVASGTSIDWMYNELNIKVSYTIEYRDQGRFGFVLPPVQILPNCQELMAGMLALVKKSKELGYA